MTTAIVQSLPSDDTVRTGPAFCKTGRHGIQHKCKLILRGLFAPFRLEIYSGSNSGKVYSLKNVKRVKFCGQFNQNASLKIRFSGSLSVYLTFLNEKEASEWMEGIQMHSLAVPKQVTSTDHKFPVILLPNSNCHLNGRHLFIVRDDAIHVCDVCDVMTSRIVWPVHTIRFYGNEGKLFSVATTSRSETGEGVFHFDPLCAKGAELIYDCIAASVTHLLQVAASVSHAPPPPPPRPPPPRAPPLSLSVPYPTPTYDHHIIPSNASAVNGFLNDDYCPLISATNGFSSRAAKDTFLWNSFYLKSIGVTIKKPTKMPEIHGLGEPKRQLLEIFSVAPDLLEQFAFSVVLYGPSNCGKQKLVEAAAVCHGAALLCLPAHCLLQLHRNHEDGIQMLFDTASALAPCIILIKQLEHILPSSSVSESDCTSCEVLQTVKDTFGKQSKPTVTVVGAISDLSTVDNPIPSLCWITRKIYVPPPCLETRRQVFAKELQGVLDSPEGSSCFDLLAQSTAGFNFVELTDLYCDVKKMVVSDAMDSAARGGGCELTIQEDLRKVKEVLVQNVSERKAYEESGLSSARYYALLHSQESALFVVKLMANEVLPGISLCFLRISDSSVDLFDLDPAHTIVSWPLRTIRLFTWTPLSFVLEVGRKNPAIEGEFHFETIASKTIFDHLNRTLLMQ